MGQTREERIAYLRRQIQEVKAQESRWRERTQLAATNNHRDFYHTHAIQCQKWVLAAQRKLKLMKEK